MTEEVIHLCRLQLKVHVVVLGHTTEHGYTNSYANNTTVEYPRFTTYLHVIDTCIIKTNCAFKTIGNEHLLVLVIETFFSLIIH